MKTNNQYLIDAIKKMLECDDLADAQRIRLFSLLAKLVPPVKRRMPQSVDEIFAEDSCAQSSVDRPHIPIMEMAPFGSAAWEARSSSVGS